MSQWVVILSAGPEGGIPYGPFTSENLAKAFARFLTDEVDPARVEKLRSPAGELLNWRANHLALERND